MTRAIPPSEDTPAGFGYALAAYLFWGVLPLYMKLLSHIPPAEVVAHRIVWSVPIAGAILLVLGRTADLRAALTSPRTLAMGAVTAALISVNWGVYVWAITSGHALEAALGYYINPLFSVLLGAVLLRERIAPLQWAAIALVAVAVLVLTIESGVVPYLALALTVTWGFYAFFKKWLPVGPNQGFMLEVLILLIPALAYLGYLTTQGQGHFGGSPRDIGLLLGCGVVTAVPLMLYANGAKGLRLTTIAILQYISPTMIFLVAVFLFDEPFGRARAIAFPMIWAAVAVYLLSVYRQRR
ncbi:MAG: EamA family transporter RarD [Rhodobacterales bacterium]|nr:EamA family transporter RarD [Rhodobacterales bacterium]NCT12989.1 EamA family transporter RarD [Rhodobacterales bacterium]